ncbi:protein-glutamate methylesterase/protein-glutamine glutaminase [Fusibacter tunisiensis]|uniref:Protein-glutamate methylesterase/protein-glutamine glutaminase n=1 Tax=Fusibacter tunisiensis TaxID=1008308 RepID=A0ABS2MMI2_9FIRM|nr:chemotaxis response regulator protein-glutamate methylesterase [Fusibacter tunisiensis]MBM7560606.1 two-component system chemotaxis response regulator CheB [Fusibacter tunisiensis]
MKIKILVVDDSAFMRKVITDMIESEANMKVIGTARNGADAIEKIKALSPDVVTMDIEMPIKDGLSALREIMRDMPVPVIMLSSLTKKGAEETLKALDYGAFDFITKPSSLIKVSTPEMKMELIEKINIASRTTVKKVRVDAYVPKIDPTKSNRTFAVEGGSTRFKKIVAIGTSTGGPRALQEVIPLIPADIDASIMIVQHMPPGFTKSLADRLDSMSMIRVKEAENGDVMKSGWAYLAPGDYHIKVTKHNGQFMIELDNGERVSGHKPSVDAMMASVVKELPRQSIGVIMTGMGADGAKGMKALKEAGGFVLAQNEESCVVFGMPKSAIKLNGVDKVVDLSNLANEIIKAMEV